jgi:hypothetical protein
LWSTENTRPTPESYSASQPFGNSKETGIRTPARFVGDDVADFAVKWDIADDLAILDGEVEARPPSTIPSNPPRCLYFFVSYTIFASSRGVSIEATLSRTSILLSISPLSHSSPPSVHPSHFFFANGPNPSVGLPFDWFALRRSRALAASASFSACRAALSASVHNTAFLWKSQQ